MTVESGSFIGTCYHFMADEFLDIDIDDLDFSLVRHGFAFCNPC